MNPSGFTSVMFLHRIYCHLNEQGDEVYVNGLSRDNYFWLDLVSKKKK